MSSCRVSSQPKSIDAILRQTLQPPPAAVEHADKPAPDPANPSPDPPPPRVDPPPDASGLHAGLRAAPPELSENLMLVARWFYSKPREGEILFREKEWPYRRILRAIGRILAPPGAAPSAAAAPPNS